MITLRLCCAKVGSEIAKLRTGTDPAGKPVIATKEIRAATLGPVQGDATQAAAVPQVSLTIATVNPEIWSQLTEGAIYQLTLAEERPSTALDDALRRAIAAEETAKLWQQRFESCQAQSQRLQDALTRTSSPPAVRPKEGAG